VTQGARLKKKRSWVAKKKECISPCLSRRPESEPDKSARALSRGIAVLLMVKPATGRGGQKSSATGGKGVRLGPGVPSNG